MSDSSLPILQIIRIALLKYLSSFLSQTYHLVDDVGSFGNRTTLEASSGQVLDQLSYGDISALEFVKVDTPDFLGSLWHGFGGEEDRVHRGSGGCGVAHGEGEGRKGKQEESRMEGVRN